jgi:membrane-associated phospholipid phosphatase
MRGVGVLEALSDAPEVVLALAALLTRLGHPVVLLAIAVVLYWRAPVDGGRLLAVTLTALAAVAALKAWFMAPRPPRALWAVPADYYAFPSGHATGAAAVYGGVAALFLRSVRTRLAAVAVVVVVAASRVVLGVHYLVDVLAGVAVGAGVVIVGLLASRHRVGPAFGLATLAGVGALALAGTVDAAARAGVAVGAAVAWAVLDPTGGESDTAVRSPVVVASLAGGAALAVGAWLLDVSLLAALAGGAVGGAGAVATRPAVPWLAKRDARERNG